MFISSYIPLFVLIILSQLKKLNKTELLLFLSKHKIFVIVISFISFFSIIILIFVFFGIGKYRDKLQKDDYGDIENEDMEILNYFITYMIPILTIDLDNNANILMNILIFIIIGVYYVDNNAIHLNLLLKVKGYKVYSSKKHNFKIISKKSIDKLHTIEEITVKKVGNIYIDKGQPK